jgi:hypothetical protein
MPFFQVRFLFLSTHGIFQTSLFNHTDDDGDDDDDDDLLYYGAEVHTSLRGKTYLCLQTLGVDERIILKRVFKK